MKLFAQAWMYDDFSSTGIHIDAVYKTLPEAASSFIIADKHFEIFDGFSIDGFHEGNVVVEFEVSEKETTITEQQVYDFISEKHAISEFNNSVSIIETCLHGIDNSEHFEYYEKTLADAAPDVDMSVEEIREIGYNEWRKMFR